jgi:hypothetical protein
MEQTNITLNMLQQRTTNSLLSANRGLDGMFSFDRTLKRHQSEVMVHTSQLDA